MAYDFAGSWSNTAGHHAQLYPGNPGEPSGSTAVDYVISTGFPANKILLGVPVYGRSFLGASGPGHAYNGCGGEEGTFEYKQLPRNNAEEIVNTRVVAAFSTGGDGGFVSYDNPETVKIKANFCLEKGLGVSQILTHVVGRLTRTGVVLLDGHCRYSSRTSKSNSSRIQSFAWWLGRRTASMNSVFVRAVRIKVRLRALESSIALNRRQRKAKHWDDKTSKITNVLMAGKPGARDHG